VPQDFAKRKQDSGSKRKPAAKTQARRTSADNRPRGSGFRLYFAGVLTGVFLSVLGYLATLRHPAATAQQETASAASPPAVEIPKPRFDFYTLLPKQTMDVDEDPVEPAAEVSNPPVPSTVPQPFFLQAGSFRQQADAERRRAELLLLGLTPKLEETNNDSGRWFRVYLGPFDTHESVTKARGLLAHQNIETVLLQRGSP
jgi:cell division protein FtsN